MTPQFFDLVKSSSESETPPGPADAAGTRGAGRGYQPFGPNGHDPHDVSLKAIVSGLNIMGIIKRP